MKMQLQHLIALAVFVLCGALTGQAQDSIVHFGTVEGRIDLPLKTPGAQAPTLSCANLRVAVWPLNGNAMQEARPQPSGVGTCSYKLPSVLIGKPHGIKLRWTGGGDYEVRFNHGQSQARFTIKQSDQPVTFHFTRLELLAVPQ